MHLPSIRPIEVIPPLLVAVAVAVVALALGHSAPSTSAASGSSKPVAASHVNVDISNFAYSPATITVKVGTTVTFTDEESVEHTATSNTSGVFETGTLQKGQAISIKLEKVGTFSYHCAFHAFMHGTIRVVA
jgi:plastocyanin